MKDGRRIFSVREKKGKKASREINTSPISSKME